MNSLDEAHQQTLANSGDGYDGIRDALRGALEGVRPLWIDTTIKNGQLADPDGVYTQIAEIEKQYGSDCMIYVYDTKTGGVYQTRPGFCEKGHVQLQSIGGGAIYDALLSNSEKVGIASRAVQQEYATKLATVGTPSLVVETGAGMDIPRLLELGRIQNAGGNLFVAHDLSPKLLEATRGKINDMLYCAIPSAFLGNIINANNGAVTVTMKDTLSSLAFGQIDTFIEALKVTPQVQRVVITQSLGEAKESNKYPLALQPSTPSFNSNIQNFLIQNPPRDGEVELTEFSGLQTVQQIYHSMGIIIMEVARNYIFAQAKKIGFKRCDTEICETHEDLSPPEAHEYISQQYPHLLHFFEQGEINEILLGPFGVHVKSNQKVAQGKLRITNQNFHFILEKRPRYQVVEKPKNLSVTPIPETDMLTPQHLRIVNPLTYVGGLPPETQESFRQEESGNVIKTANFSNKTAFLMLYKAWTGLNRQDVTEAFLHKSLLKYFGLSIRK